MKPPWWALKPLRVLSAFLLLIGFFGSSEGSYTSGSEAVVDQPHKVFIPVTIQIFAPQGPHSPPRASISYYFWMYQYTQAKARNLGCQVGTADLKEPGKQESLVVLDFGITKYKDGKYGASGMQGGGFVTMAQIADAVEQFGLGYWDCTETDFESELHIAIGTNNYNNPDVYSYLSVTYGHGKAWAQMVNQVNDWFLNVCPDSCNGQVDAMGANDIELAWSSPSAAIDWLNGYDSANQYALINFGAAEGCPNYCGGGGYYWTKDQVLRVTNSGPVYSLPEIYGNSGVHANQWYQLSLYSVQKYGYPFDFAGTLTQYMACVQSPGDSLCSVLDNTPEQGWQQLYDKVNRDPLTFDDLKYSSDIQWTD